MKAVTPYLHFNGKTEEAFNFYKSVFGGEFSTLQRFKDMPSSERVPAKEKNNILHIALPLGKAGILLGSDSPEYMGRKVNFGNNIHLAIDTESEAEAKMLFTKLSEGGKVDMPLKKMFWGALYASFTDKFGVNWMISFTQEQPS